jgi:hypothetical protein
MENIKVIAEVNGFKVGDVHEVIYETKHNYTVTVWTTTESYEGNLMRCQKTISCDCVEFI